MQQRILRIKVTNKSEIYYSNKATKGMETMQNQKENSYDDELSYQDEHWKIATGHRKRKIIPNTSAMKISRYRKATMTTRHPTPKFIRITNRRNRYGPKRKGHNSYR